MNLADYPRLDVPFDAYGGAGGYLTRETPPTSYWPTVVASGNVEWACELLTACGADPNWPRSETYPRFCNHEIGLGATVLMIAILKQDVGMVKLLIKHGADVNLTEVVHFYPDSDDHDEYWFVHFHPEDEYEDSNGYWFVNDDMLMHYWGTTDKDALEFPLDAPDDKKATPLSVALGTGNDGIVELLREHGAEEAPFGSTPASVPALNCGVANASAMMDERAAASAAARLAWLAGAGDA